MFILFLKYNQNISSHILTLKNNKKSLILHCGYPKAGSTYIIENIIKISINENCINVNNNGELLECFESIRNFSNESFNAQYNKIKKKLLKNLSRKRNFFGYERILNITDKPEKKIRFLKRFKKISKDINLNLKLCIFLRNEIEMIESGYKEDYFRLIFRNYKNYLFKNYVHSILDGNEKNLMNNLNFKSNLNNIYKIVTKKNVYVQNLENLKNNQEIIFKQILNFSGIKNFNINLLSKTPLNSSRDKNLIGLIQLRIKDYLFFKKKINFFTFVNIMEIFLRVIFFQKFLDKSVKIDKKSKKKIMYKFNYIIKKLK